jgi:hypothetical protein
MSLAVDAPAGDALGILSRFRVEFYECLYKRANVLFELTDALLCTDEPVKTLVELSLAAEHRCGHGAMYAALDRGWLEPTRLRHTLATLPIPRRAAPTSDDRLSCHVSTAAAAVPTKWSPAGPTPSSPPRTGRTSWTALLDAVRLGPADHASPSPPPNCARSPGA